MSKISYIGHNFLERGLPQLRVQLLYNDKKLKTPV